jgi:hypothetical protein
VFLRATSKAQKEAIYSEFSSPEAGVDDPGLPALVANDQGSKIAEFCGGQAPTAGTISGAQPPKPVLPLLVAVPLADLAGWVISQAGTWVVNQVDAKMQADLATYTSTTATSSGVFDFYDDLGMSNVRKGDETKSMCFRLTQLVAENPEDPKSKQIVAVDFVGKVEYNSQSPQVVNLSPVRLYVRKILARTNNDSASVNVKITMDAAWLDSNRGSSQTGVIDTSLATETVKPTTLPFYKSYIAAAPAGISDAKAGAREIAVSMPPWDYGGKNYRHNRANATVTVLEVGNIPWLLKNAAALLHNNKDGVAADLVAEAKKEATAKINPGGGS